MDRFALSQGDYVEHKMAPHVVWQVVAVDPYTPNGGQATLRWVGGSLTWKLRQEMFNVYDGPSDVCLIRDLDPANPMLVIAMVVSK